VGRLVVSNYVPRFDVDRLTLTAPTINHVHEVVSLVEGASKGGDRPGVVEGPHDPDQLPAKMIQPEAER
jgi:6-phosphogluconolactonase/glucosamine-6-phosphate isomerase/deaminase